MRKLQNTEQRLIENIIDATTVAEVLTAIETICNEKSVHIATNWQDAKTAKVWDRAASVVADARNKIQV